MTIANETTPAGQAAHADAQYLTGATGLPVQDDQTARLALDDGAHTTVANSALATSLNTTSKTNASNGMVVKTYSGGNQVTAVSPTYAETKVKTALDAHNIFTKGNFLPDDVYSTEKSYHDPAYLMEASKLTGEKFF